MATFALYFILVPVLPADGQQTRKHVGEKGNIVVLFKQGLGDPGTQSG